jgi:SAM-dependent methyltransferase
MKYWYENWFDENYLKLYNHRDSADAKKQVKLIENKINLTSEMSILDLCCGEGRHSILFQEKGYLIKGIDQSEVLINQGKKKYPVLDLFVQDMRSIKGKYDLILSLFTSFGYFDDDDENYNILKSIGSALNPDGYFWFDYLNSYNVVSNLVPHSEREISESILVTEDRRIKNNMIIKDIKFGDHEYQERVKLYNKDELLEMFIQNGITPLEIYGDYSGSEWEKDSKRTIILGKKSE